MNPLICLVLIFFLIACQTLKIDQFKISKTDTTIFRYTTGINKIVDTTTNLTLVYIQRNDTINNNSLRINQIENWLNQNKKWRKYSYPKGGTSTACSFIIQNNLDLTDYYFTLHPNYIFIIKFDKKKMIPIYYRQPTNDTTFQFIKNKFITHR